MDNGNNHQWIGNDHETKRRRQWLNDKDMYSDDFHSDDDEDGGMILGALLASVILMIIIVLGLWFVLGTVDIGYLLGD